MAAIHIAVKNNDTRGDPTNVLSGTLRNALKLQPNAKIGLASLIYSVPPTLLTIGTNQRVGWATPASGNNPGRNYMSSVVSAGNYATLAEICVKVQAALNECQTSYYDAQGTNCMVNSPYASLTPMDTDVGYQEAYAAAVDLRTHISRIAKQNKFTPIASDGSAWANQTANLTLTPGTNGRINVTDNSPWSFQYVARSSIGAWFASLDLGAASTGSLQLYGEISITSVDGDSATTRFDLNLNATGYDVTIATPVGTYNLGTIDLPANDRCLLVGVIRAGQNLIVVYTSTDDDGTIDVTTPWILHRVQNLSGFLRDIWYDSVVQISGEVVLLGNYSLYNIGNVPSTTVRSEGWIPPPLIAVNPPQELGEEVIASIETTYQQAIEAALIDESMPWTDLIEEQAPGNLGAITSASARFSPGDLGQLLGFNFPNTGWTDNRYILQSNSDATVIISDFAPDGGNVEVSTINVISNSISLGGAIIDDTGYGDDISLLDVVAGLQSSSSVVVYNGNPPRYVSIRNSGELTISELKFTLLASGGGPAKVSPGATMMLSIVGANL